MQNQQKLKDSPALCMVAAGLLEDGSSTMYVAAANPLEEAALGRLNPNRRWQQTKRIASAPVRACAPALSYIMLKAGLMPTAQLGGSKAVILGPITNIIVY